MLVSRMLGFFGMIGRSKELQILDQALRGVSLHPRFVPEAIKLTVVKLLKKTSLEPRPYDAAAQILGYCLLGAQSFSEANDPELTEAVEARLLTALEEGDSLDAEIILLTLHAGAIQGSVVDRFGLEAH